jgi:hypothetical protein
VYPPFDDPHMLAYRDTRHHQTQNDFEGVIHCAGKDVLLVQITQSYPNRLGFWSLPCPESLCHTVTYELTRTSISTRCACG